MRDNPGLLLALIGLLLAALVAMVTLADRSVQLSPDFLSEVVLYALSAADLTILVALAFVLARNIIKLVVERRRGLPFARFRSKLVLALLGMTIVPSLLVLFVGSELIRNSASRWFSAPIDEVLASASRVAAAYYRERQQQAAELAGQVAADLAPHLLRAEDLASVRDAAAAALRDRHVGLIEVYRVEAGGAGARVVPLIDVAAPSLPSVASRAVADRLAAQAVADGSQWQLESLGDEGELVRAAEVIRQASGRPGAVVVVSELLTGELAMHSRRIVEAYEGYSQLRVLRRPLEGVYLSFFLMMTLLILVSATWMGLYLAKRITRPVRALSEGAREIGAGHLDHRIALESRDEFGSLVDAFNTMAEELAVSRRRLERSREDLESTNQQLDLRRRYIETILERVATGVISVDADGRVGTVNGAAARLLRLGPDTLGRPIDDVLARNDLSPLAPVLERARRRRGDDAVGQEVMLTLDGREVYLVVATTPLAGEAGGPGLVIVVDDVTPLIRAQKVAAWRDVARRLAHEVKNPLTPIQLCAERLRRHFGGAPEPTRRLVAECSGTIVQEVESLKQLVDEFSQFARMPPPRTAPTDLRELVADVIGLYRAFPHVRIETRIPDALPAVRVDPEQFRRVVINLVDNAIEALGEDPAPPAEGGTIGVDASHEPAHSVVRLVVSDNGPGLSEADRAKIFMPYYSTKKRGSGLGLAIVRRIVVEHGGSIEASDNLPRGTRMTIDLPC